MLVPVSIVLLTWYELDALRSAQLVDRGTGHADDGTAGITAWMIRALGLVLMASGFAALVPPLLVLREISPFLRRLLGGGAALAILLLTALFGSGAIAAPWLFFDAFTAASILAGGMALTVVLWLVIGVRGSRGHAASPSARTR
jgi:hypothetical protein